MTDNVSKTASGEMPEQTQGNIKDGFQQPQATIPLDVSDGQSHFSGGSYTTQYSEENGMEADTPVKAIPTAPFTQADSIYLRPNDTVSAFVGNLVNNQGSETHVPSSSFRYRNIFTARNPRPTFYNYGTNWLIPYGAWQFINSIGSTSVTSINSTAVRSAATLYNTMTPSNQTRGSFREVANFRRVQQLRNVVISYFNRSIPFTDLGDGDRFAIEIKYMADLARVMLPIFAKNYALSLVRHWSKSHMNYDVSRLARLNSQELDRYLLRIYQVIGNLPVLDDVMMKRLCTLTKVHVSSARAGYLPVVILQDVKIGSISNYNITGTIGPYSLPETILPDPGFTEPGCTRTNSFNDWVAFWLRSDLGFGNTNEALLETWLKYAQTIRPNYQVMLAAVQQLEQKGSITYSRAAEYLPIAGANDYTLDYKIHDPVFDYAYKERVEYAPRSCAAETAGGSNFHSTFNIANLPDDVSSSFATISCIRPYGLYKDGDQIWNTSELTEIGLFKPIANILPLSGSIETFCDWVKQYCTAAGTTMNSYRIHGTIELDHVYFQDAYYGDIYTSVQSVANTVADCDFYYIDHPIISYYGIVGNENAPFACLNTRVRTGLNATNMLLNYDGCHILDYYNCRLSEASGSSSWNGSYVVSAIARLFNQMDLTFYLSSTKNDAGETCDPIAYLADYRGCIWDEFDISVLDNAFAQSFQALTLAMKSKALKSVREGE